MEPNAQLVQQNALLALLQLHALLAQMPPEIQITTVHALEDIMMPELPNVLLAAQAATAVIARKLVFNVIQENSEFFLEVFVYVQVDTMK
jgi:hypothetical protein